MGTKGIDGDPSNADLQTELAAFLIAAGEYSYYRCGGWSHTDATWYPVYDKKLGEPLANATLGKDGVWRRSFAAGTDVTFDTNTNVGTIVWGEDKAWSELMCKHFFFWIWKKKKKKKKKG